MTFVFFTSSWIWELFSYSMGEK